MNKFLGFSLLENLVAIFVLSIGVLGDIGLQVHAIQSVRETRNHSMAISLAAELAEIVRGNKSIGIIKTGLNQSDNPYVGAFASPFTARIHSDCLSVDKACPDATNVANAQMTDWLVRVDTQLPGAKVVICFDSEPFDVNGVPRWTCDYKGDIMVIKIGWTKSSTDRSKIGIEALDRALIPSIVSQFTAGSI